jgi:hypothetical protein
MIHNETHKYRFGYVFGCEDMLVCDIVNRSWILMTSRDVALWRNVHPFAA